MSVRRVTANRPRLNVRRPVSLDESGYLYVSGLRVARFIPERRALEFVARDRRRNSGQPRIVEVTLTDLVRELARMTEAS